MEPELYTELSMLKNAMEGADYSLAALKEKMCTYKAFFPQVTRLVHLLLVIPATSATAERSFSSLRKIKTYLPTTMKQERLNHLMMIYIHQDRKINIKQTMSEFISCNKERIQTFGAPTL